MDAPSLFWLAAKGSALGAGLLGPGAALMTAARLPRTVATCFSGSAVALYATVLTLQLSGAPITPVSLAAGLLLISAGAVVVGRTRSTVPPGSPAPPYAAGGGNAGLRTSAPLTGMSVLLPVYLLFWVAVAWRAWHQPLAGPDVEFRWSFLAEQMLRLGTLDFYPPRSAADFVSYFWVESIPPGASALHAWAYACAGGSHASWTVPAVILQVWSVHELVWHAADRSGGRNAARIAVLALAACPLLTWSMLIGQETGLTALALAGIACALMFWRSTRNAKWAALAGLFATLGAAAREYGLVFPLLAGGALWFWRAERRAWFALTAAAALGAVWPLRTWILTGNPFYSLSPGGLFPANARFVAWIESDADAFGAALKTLSGWDGVIRYLVLFAPAALLGWIGLGTAIARRQRDAVLALAAVALLLALWATSVRYTNGGLFYSLRVTSPALVLGCLSLGLGVAALLSPRPGLATILTFLVGVGVVAQLPATLALPQSPWRVPWRAWPAFAPTVTSPAGLADETVALVMKATGGKPGVVIADAPGFQRRFSPLGVTVIPLWSPQADWLFDPTLPPAEAVRRWRESQVRTIIVTKWQANLDFFTRHSRGAQPPFQTQVIGETKDTAVVALRAVE
ncbi:hypothetical protein [Horticoccus sp. 23ND18S-11]|uniref:hypothetical protein n=1 Tax=Horticoccus sp. 23ND18S-11 TaxID=3391832 RepID=UPI0039C90B8F